MALWVGVTARGDRFDLGQVQRAKELGRRMERIALREWVEILRCAQDDRWRARQVGAEPMVGRGQVVELAKLWRWREKPHP